MIVRDSHHILIVDDEPNVRLMFRTALESSGENTAEAEDGEAALARLAGSRFDLILLDLQMPGLDGMGTLRRLREGGDDTPVVIVTAHGSVPDAVEAMKLGAIDFLSKPLTARRASAGSSPRSAPASGTARSRPTPEPAEPVTVEGEFAANLARAKRAINLREFAGAEVHLKQALALKGSSADALNLMGVLLELRDDDRGAYRSYRAALKADPDHGPARHNMTRHYERFTFGGSEVPVDTGER